MAETQDLQNVIDLTARLSPRDQLKLVASIGERLSAELPAGGATAALPGSAAAVLRAAREPPHLCEEDVAELERAIREGALPVRQTSPFDERTDR